ncbi:MAG: hypothetical protein P5680_25630, partial [Limnospira sp. PMC 737.11]|nr:hypothetical protein [Limnospira sp. PMC 737.11]
ETGFLVVGWVKRSDTQQIRVYKLGDRSPFLKVVGWVKRSDTQQIQVRCWVTLHFTQPTKAKSEGILEAFDAFRDRIFAPGDRLNVRNDIPTPESAFLQPINSSSRIIGLTAMGDRDDKHLD